MSFFDTFKKHLAAELPFVVYRKAGSSQVQGLFQKSTTLHEVSTFAEKGFIFAPFAEGKTFYIPQKDAFSEAVDIEEVTDVTLKQAEVSAEENEEEREAFESLVLRCKESIANKAFSKVVPSRREEMYSGDIAVDTLFKQILLTYPKAFCSIVYHPQVGMWLGATPESLLRIEDNVLYTMALAGTQVNHGAEEVVWGNKEQEEQQYVTDFIVESLQPYAKDIRVSLPFTKRAARVMHICTTIEADLREVDLKALVTALHPTPAVCGMPKAPARAFLLKEEGYDRKYYAGYLGELNYTPMGSASESADLYVNLRCMEIEKGKVNLYIGCGVTKDSDPNLEYVETVNKATTMKQVLIN